MAKHHLLINASYRLSVTQQRLILSLISQIHPQDEEFHRYFYKISDLCKLLKINKKNLKERQEIFVNTLNVLQKQLIEIVFRQDGCLKLGTPSWIAEPVFDFKADLVSLTISETLKPYLLQLTQKGRFASYRLAETSSFRSLYSYRFLELCHDLEPRHDFHDLIINNRYVKKQFYKISAFREMLGLKASQYKKPRQLKEKVLTTAHSEIVRHTASYFEFEMVKKGREVVGVEFLVYGPAVGFKNISLSESQKPLVALARKLGCSERFATSFVVEFSHKLEKVRQAVMAVEEYWEWLTAQGDKLKFPASAVKNAFFEGWHSRRWHEKQERELREAEQEAREEELKDLQKALKQLARHEKAGEKALESQWKAEQDHQNDKYQTQRDNWAGAYEKLETEKRLDFIMTSLPVDSLKILGEDELKKLKTTIGKFSRSQEYGFKEIYDMAFNLLLEHALPGGKTAS